MGLLDDKMQAPPRNRLMGLLADALQGAQNYAAQPGQGPGGRRNPPLNALAGLLGVQSLATTADRMSYGNALTNAGKANVPFLKPETADALMMAPLSPRTALAALGMGGPVGLAHGGHEAMMLYHGSGGGDPLRKIDTVGTRFDGLFGSPSRITAQSHGTGPLYRMTVPDESILTQSDLNNFSNSAIKKAIGTKSNSIMDMVVNPSRANAPEITGIFDKSLGSDAGAAGWELQRLRGQMAKKLGFKAVEMPDEHGASYLVVGDVKPRPYNQEARDSVRGILKPPEPPSVLPPYIEPNRGVDFRVWQTFSEAKKIEAASGVWDRSIRNTSDRALVAQYAARNGQSLK